MPWGRGGKEEAWRFSSSQMDLLFKKAWGNLSFSKRRSKFPSVAGRAGWQLDGGKMDAWEG